MISYFKKEFFNYSLIVRFLIFTILKLAKSALWKWITIFNGITTHHTSKIFQSMEILFFSQVSHHTINNKYMFISMFLIL
jgi:hypothetical protein